jgi:hypothetical protein
MLGWNNFLHIEQRICTVLEKDIDLPFEILGFHQRLLVSVGNVLLEIRHTEIVLSLESLVLSSLVKQRYRTIFEFGFSDLIFDLFFIWLWLLWFTDCQSTTHEIIHVHKGSSFKVFD